VSSQSLCSASHNHFTLLVTIALLHSTRQNCIASLCSSQLHHFALLVTIASAQHKVIKSVMYVNVQQKYPKSIHSFSTTHKKVSVRFKNKNVISSLFNTVIKYVKSIKHTTKKIKSVHSFSTKSQSIHSLCTKHFAQALLPLICFA
jgi:hemoglobin-like flavoprotein